MSPSIRTLDAVAGLLSAGLLALGVLLFLAVVVAPVEWTVSGLPAPGPGWPRVLAHLAVGVGGECVVRFRGGWARPARIGADLAVIAASLLVLAWSWLP